MGHDDESDNLKVSKIRLNIKGFRGLIPRLAFRIFFAIILVLASLRDYLFGNGLFVYRDWSWPLSTSSTPFSVFSPQIVRNSGPDPLGFTRMFLNWPITIIDSLTGNPITAEKSFILYLYGVLVLLSFILAEVLLKVNNRFGKHPLSKWRTELFILFVVVFSFANLWTIQQFSDMYYTYIYGLLVTGIAAGTIILREADWKAVILSSIAVSTIVFLAPEIYPFCWLAAAIVALRAIGSQFPFYKAMRTAATKMSVMFAINLPAVATTLYIFTITFGTGLRPLDTGSGLAFIWPQDAVRLLGYGWSLITYATPTAAAAASVSKLATIGSPPYLIYGTDAVSILWMATTWLVPLAAFLSLLFRRYRKITIPTGTVAAIGLLLAEPVLFPLPHLIALALQGQATLGGAVATLFAIPDHALIMVAVAYTVLVPTAFYQMLSSSTTIHLRRPNFGTVLDVDQTQTRPSRTTRASRMILLAGFLILIVLPGWQFFSGAFFPASYAGGITGNGIPNTATFSPTQPPQGMVQVYKWLQSQQGSYNTYWPGPDGNSGYSWSQKSTPSIGYFDSPQPTIQNWVLNPTSFPSALRYLVQSNLTMDLAPFLGALNMRYLVVQQLSNPDMSAVWGVSDLSRLTGLLEATPGVSLAYSNQGVSVFEVDNTWGSSYMADTVGSYPAGDSTYGTAYGLLYSAGNRLALTNSNNANRLCFDSFSCTLGIESPAYISTTLLDGTRFEILDNSSFGSPLLSIVPGTVSQLPVPWHTWTLANWGPGQATESIVNGIVHWAFGTGQTLISLSYNGTVTSDNPGGITVPANMLESVSVRFLYRTSEAFSSGIQITLPTLDDQEKYFASPSSSLFQASESWTEANFTTTLPSATRDFTARIEAAASDGWVEIKDVQISTGLLKPDNASYFGTMIPSNNEPEELVLPHGYTNLQYTGNGTVTCNNQRMLLKGSTKLAWIKLDPCSAGKVLLTGVSIGAAIVSNILLPTTGLDEYTASSETGSITVSKTGTVVVAKMFASGYTLKGADSNYSPSRTTDGMMIFQNVKPGVYKLTFSAINTALVAYFGTFAFLALVALTPAQLSRIRKGPQSRETIPAMDVPPKEEGAITA